MFCTIIVTWVHTYISPNSKKLKTNQLNISTFLCQPVIMIHCAFIALWLILPSRAFRSLPSARCNGATFPRAFFVEPWVFSPIHMLFQVFWCNFLFGLFLFSLFFLYLRCAISVLSSLTRERRDDDNGEKKRNNLIRLSKEKERAKKRIINGILPGNDRAKVDARGRG